MRHLPIAWTALLLLVSDSRSLGAQPCPENGFWANRVGHAEWFSSAPIYTSPGGELSYNLITGSLEASLFGGFIEISQGMTVQDRYRIVGPASGSRIPVHVQVHFSGEAGGGIVDVPTGGSTCFGSRVSLQLASGANINGVTFESQLGTPCTGTEIDIDLALDLQKLPGEEFPISVSIGLVTGRVRAFAAGVLTFANLPPGYSIQSCQGYTGTPVPVARRTWGAIKQLYR